MARLCTSWARHDEAKAVFETALSLDPENLIALKHLGDISRNAGDVKGAREWYQRVLEADPRNEEIAQIMLSLLSLPEGTPAIGIPVMPAHSTEGSKTTRSMARTICCLPTPRRRRRRVHPRRQLRGGASSKSTSCSTSRISRSAVRRWVQAWCQTWRRTRYRTWSQNPMNSDSRKSARPRTIRWTSTETATTRSTFHWPSRPTRRSIHLALRRRPRLRRTRSCQTRRWHRTSSRRISAASSTIYRSPTATTTSP